MGGKNDEEDLAALDAFHNLPALRLARDNVALINPDVYASAFKVSRQLKREIGILARVTDEYFGRHRNLLV